MNTAYKIYAKIITKRLNIISESLLEEEENGFRRWRSCSDCIFIMQQIMQKRRQFNLPMYILFVDYVTRSKLWEIWEIMRTTGYPEHLVHTIESLYKNTIISIENGTRTRSRTEVINQGVKQRCPLSPVLFCIYMNDAIKAWQREITSEIELSDRVINTILFADDQAVFGTSEDDLQRAAYKLNKAMAEYN